MIVLFYISVLAYSFFSGWKDAVLWSREGYDAYTWDEHIIFIGERISVAMVAATAYYFDKALWLFLVSGVCSLASFFAVHNGMYYLGRRWIDQAYLTFYADTKGNNTFNMPAKIRIPLFIVSTITVIYLEFLF